MGRSRCKGWALVGPEGESSEYPTQKGIDRHSGRSGIFPGPFPYGILRFDMSRLETQERRGRRTVRPERGGGQGKEIVRRRDWLLVVGIAAFVTFWLGHRGHVDLGPKIAAWLSGKPTEPKPPMVQTIPPVAITASATHHRNPRLIPRIGG
jgi:hypothetical protein